MISNETRDVCVYCQNQSSSHFQNSEARQVLAVYLYTSIQSIMRLEWKMFMPLTSRVTKAQTVNKSSSALLKPKSSTSRLMRLWGYQKAVSSLYIRRDSPFRKLLFPEFRKLSYVSPLFLIGFLFSTSALSTGYIYCADPLVSIAELLPLVELVIEAGTAMGWPRAFAVTVTSSLSINSRVVRVSSSTSAAVRPLVGIGLRTVCGQYLGRLNGLRCTYP